MSVATYQGIVANGRIVLREEVALPENTAVYVVVPEIEALPRTPRVYSPRLVNREDAETLRKVMVGMEEDDVWTE